jgi:hypothetical protein
VSRVDEGPCDTRAQGGAGANQVPPEVRRAGARLDAAFAARSAAVFPVAAFLTGPEALDGLGSGIVEQDLLAAPS